MKLKAKKMAMGKAKGWLALAMGAMLAAFGAVSATAADSEVTAYRGQSVQFAYTNDTGAKITGLEASVGVVLSGNEVAPGETVTAVITNAAEGVYGIFADNVRIASCNLTTTDEIPLAVGGRDYTETIQSDSGLLGHNWWIDDEYGTENIDSQLNWEALWWAQLSVSPRVPGLAGLMVYHTTPWIARDAYPRAFLVYENVATNYEVVAEHPYMEPLTLKSAGAGAWAAWSDDPDVVQVSVEGDGDTCTPVITGLKAYSTGTIHVENAFTRYTISVTVLPFVKPFELYPLGDGGVFVPSAKGRAQYLGTVIDASGVAGTIELTMTKPNKKTGLFNIQAKVKTLVDKQTYSFKAKKVQSAVDGPLTITLEGSNAKSWAHTLVVTLEGNSLTGSFDGAVIDGAKYVKKSAAILPFVGTWSGAFISHAAAEDVERPMFLSVNLTKSGVAKVKVQLAGSKILSCSTKAEVGADGIVAVPVMISRSVKGVKESVGFRVVFDQYSDGTTACEVVNVSPVRYGANVIAFLEFLAADRMTVTSKEFKTFVITVDPTLTEKFGPITRNGLKLTASSGLISGSLKWGKIKGKASGVMIGGSGFGTLIVKIDGVESEYGFAVGPAEVSADMN